MGTNFYLMSRNKKLIREYFAVETEYDIKDIEYAIVDEPYLGYEIHLNKLSCGWRPLFQRHKTKVIDFTRYIDTNRSSNH